MMRVVAASSAPGEVAGYVVGECIGAGGFGEVYRASHVLMNRSVAIKVLSPRYSAEPDAVARFVAEAQAVARISHPNIVEVFDFGVLGDGRHYCVMELLRGKTLREVLRERTRLPVAEALPILRGIAEAVDAAHAVGIAHRDLKPDNVFVVDGRVKLIDFGLAKLVTEEAVPITKTGSVFGTPLYMSPEQCRGSDVGLATDAYSFGVLAYHVLVGDPPWTGEALDLALHHVNDAPPPPSSRCGELSSRVDRVVLALLAKNPDERPQSLVGAIDAIVDGALPKRRVRAKTIRIGIGVALATVATVATIAILRPSTNDWRPEIKDLPSYSENSDAPAISPDGKWIAYVSDRERPGWFRMYVEPLDGGRSRAITPPNWQMTWPRWTHDGSAILSRHDDDLVRIPVADPERVTVLATRPAFADFGVEVEDCAGRLLLAERTSPTCASCNRLVMRDRDGGETVIHQLAANETALYPRCNRAGTQIVFGALDRARNVQNDQADLWIVGTDGSAPRRLTNDRRIGAASFTPDGTVVAAALRDGKWNLWEFFLDGRAPRQLTFGQGSDVGPDVSVDGRFVLFNNDTTAHAVYALTGSGQRRITSKLELYNDLSVSADGKHIFVGVTGAFGAQIKRIALADETEATLAAGHTPVIAGNQIAYITPDRRHIALVSPDGGSSRMLAAFDHDLVDVLAFGEGAVHASVINGSEHEATRIPLASGIAEREAPAPWCLVIPAPTGGWRAAVKCGGSDARVFGPGEALDPEGPRKIAVRAGRIGWDPDGTSFVYHRGSELRRYTVATGDDTKLVDHSIWLYGIAAAGDRKTVYTIGLVAQVRRQLITNFADR